MKTKETIKVKANQRNRTFTIRRYEGDKLCFKARTNPMSREEFESEENNTENDWKYFLKSDDYYIVN
jgi:hypothetical protein